MPTDGMTPTKWEAEYAQGTPHWAEDMAPSAFAKEFVKELKDRGIGDVLEIGCGNGRDSIYFSKQDLRVTSVDVSPSALEMAKINAEKAKAKVNFELANANYLQFGSGSFGSVFSLSVLHSTHLDKSIPEVYRVLRSRGYAFIYIYGSTIFKTGEPKEIISTDNYIRLLKLTGFVIWDFYTEEESGFDSYGEKHRLLVAKLGKG